MSKSRKLATAMAITSESLEALEKKLSKLLTAVEMKAIKEDLAVLKRSYKLVNMGLLKTLHFEQKKPKEIDDL